MKLNRTDWFKRDEGTILANFGEARLVKQLDGKLELRGGTPDDRRTAKKWISLFLPTAAIDWR